MHRPGFQLMLDHMVECEGEPSNFVSSEDFRVDIFLSPAPRHDSQLQGMYGRNYVAVENEIKQSQCHRQCQKYHQPDIVQGIGNGTPNLLPINRHE